MFRNAGKEESECVRRYSARICIVAVMLVAGCGLSKSTIYPGTALTPDLHEEGIVELGR